MKFSCEKQVLQTAAVTAARASAAKSPITSLEGLLVNAGVDVRITGYDLKKGIYSNIEADVSQPGSAVLNAKLFTEMLRRLPDGIVTVEIDDKNAVSVKCGRGDFAFVALDADDYPELPELNEAEAVSIPQKTLRAMIDETVFAVSTNEARPVYMGSLFQIEDGTLTVVAVDGYRLALRREPLEGGRDGMKFIVPGSALQDIERICADSDEPVLINVGDKHVSFAIDNTVVITRRLEGDFLNYKKSIPEIFRFTVGINRDEFLSVVDRTSLFVDEKLKSALHLIFGDDRIDFYCAAPTGRAEDVCSCTGNGGDTEIGFNDRYLRDALRAAPSEDLLFCINTGSSPAVIRAADDSNDSFRYMILPVRLRPGE